jgi:hypothetical protein
VGRGALPHLGEHLLVARVPGRHQKQDLGLSRLDLERVLDSARSEGEGPRRALGYRVPIAKVTSPPTT